MFQLFYILLHFTNKLYTNKLYTMKLNELIPKNAPKNKAVHLTKGYILFEGKSNINAKSIIGILTTKTANKKTGQMTQLWILSSEMRPTDASKAKIDSAVCGNCPLRQSMGGACYVNLGHAPNSVFKSWKRGNYTNLSIEDYNILSGFKIRFGAYGDPYALPIDILTKLKGVAVNNTSYTHQWKKGSDTLKSLSMASVNNITEQKEAVKKGWRTFRVATKQSEVLKNEVVCPNITSGINCADCRLCGGASSKAKNIVVLVHGSWKKRF